MGQKTALVTGQSGQDAYYLSKYLLNEGYRVVGMKRRSTRLLPDRVNELLNFSTFSLIDGDVIDPASISEVIKSVEPQEVYNLAAQSHVAASFDQPFYTFEATGLGVMNILESIRTISPKIKFYQASSSEMFGKNYDVKQSLSPNVSYKYQNEDTSMYPQSPYAIAKLAAHHMVRLYRDAYGIFACSGILFNHESPERGEEFVTRKITKWLGEFKRWRDETNFPHIIPVENDKDHIYQRSGFMDSPKILRFPKLRLGNLEACRDWGHAKDYVRAMHLMLQQEVPDDYVISTGKSHSIKEFIDLAFKYAGINDDPMKYIVIDPKFYRPAEVDFLCGDSSKARFLLNWKPEYSFDDLVREMVEHDS